MVMVGRGGAYEKKRILDKCLYIKKMHSRAAKDSLLEFTNHVKQIQQA